MWNPERPRVELHRLKETKEIRQLDSMWNAELDFGTEGHWWENCQNLNKAYRLVHSIVSMLISWLTTRKDRWRIYQNTLYYFCKFLESLKLFQNLKFAFFKKINTARKTLFLHHKDFHKHHSGILGKKQMTEGWKVTKLG